MSTAFEQAYKKTKRHEGGYTETGPTYKGVDRRFWPSWEGWTLVDDWKAGSITAEARDKALEIPLENFYRINFWDRIRGDEVAKLSLPLVIAMFDFAVNSDVPDAVRSLQQALNRLNHYGKTYPDLALDGKLGPQTLNTLRHCLQTSYGGDVRNAERLVMSCFTGERYIHMVGCPDVESWPGWYLRLDWCHGHA